MQVWASLALPHLTCPVLVLPRARGWEAHERKWEIGPSQHHWWNKHFPLKRNSFLLGVKERRWSYCESAIVAPLGSPRSRMASSSNQTDELWNRILVLASLYFLYLLMLLCFMWNLVCLFVCFLWMISQPCKKRLSHDTGQALSLKQMEAC